MNKTYFLPFLLVAAVSAVATADTYTNFLTGVSSVQSDGTPEAAGGNWDVTGATLEKVSGKNAFEFETQGASMMTLSEFSVPDTNTIVKIELDVTVEEVTNLLVSLPAGAQTAFAVSTNAYNAWNGSAWVALDEVPSGIDDSQTTNLIVEIKYLGDASAHKRFARFSIGSTSTPLHVRTNGSEWVELATDANNFNALKVNGSGTFAQADASVMIGIAEYDGVKYGTLAAAVEEAEKDVSKPIEVLRETNESVELPNGAKIADNGNVKGEITVPANAEVEVQPEAAEFVSTTGADVGTSGSYTIPVNVSGGTVNVKLPNSMSNKEIVGPLDHSGTTVSFEIQTASSVLAAANPTGLTAAPTNDIAKLRTYLAAHTNDAYIAANASPETIKAALEATRENGLKLYQSYALGIPPTTSVKPVTVASDSDTSNITLSIPGLTSATPSGDYTVKYMVGDTEQSGASSIKIPLATGNTRVKIVLSDK